MFPQIYCLCVAGSGEHISPEQFHNEITAYLQNRLKKDDQPYPIPKGSTSCSPLVLLDVRNAYETEIGRFEITSENGDEVLVPVYDPLTRTVCFVPFFTYSRHSLSRTDSFLISKDILITTSTSLPIRKY